jgi:hypothetical protein
VDKYIDGSLEAEKKIAFRDNYCNEDRRAIDSPPTRRERMNR